MRVGRQMVLAACSPWFQSLLRRNPHQHPLIYLKGVSWNSLQLILSFMYLGETKVSQQPPPPFPYRFILKIQKSFLKINIYWRRLPRWTCRSSWKLRTS